MGVRGETKCDLILVLFSPFSHVQCPSFSTFSDPLYTGEIYESNRLHLNPSSV